jgi:O-antigen/teichoic acid export membrane protein
MADAPVSRPAEGLGGEEEDGPPRSTSFSAFTTLASQIAIAVLALGNVIVIGRILGPSGRGSVAFLTTVGFISSWLATLGVDQSISNMGAQAPHMRRALAGNAVVLALIFGGIAASVVLVGTLIFPQLQGDASRELLTLVMLNVPLLVLQIYLRQLTAAQYHFTIGNLTAIVPALVNIVGNLALYFMGNLSVTSAILTWLIGQAIGTLWLCWYVHARLEGFGRPSLPVAREAVRFGLRAHTSHTMNLGNYRADQWIMGILSTPQQLGLYSVAVSWSEALFLIPQALMQVQRPDLARSQHHQAGPSAAFVFRISILVTIILCAGMVAAAPILCVTVFGDQFQGSVVDLRIVALGGFGIVAVKLLGSALTAQGRPLRESLAVGTTFITVLALDFILIPSLGGEGASIASAVGYSAGGLAMVGIFCFTMKVRLRTLMPTRGTVRDIRVILANLRRGLGVAVSRLAD